MSVNTLKNYIRYPGYSPKVEGTYFGATAPTITTGFLAGDEWWVTSDGTSNGTPLAVYRFDTVTSTWQKYPSSSKGVIIPSLVPVLDILTTPPAQPTDQDAYIVQATATGAWAGKEGDIAIWDAGANTWKFYSPKNGDATSVLTGDNIGTWTYDSATDSWSQTSTLPSEIATTTRPTASNMAFFSEFDELYRPLGSLVVVMNDQLAGWGAQVTGNNAGDNTNATFLPRKMPFVWSSLQSGGNTRNVLSYAPQFVDGSYCNVHSLAIDHKGLLWATGTSQLGTGMTTTPDGTTTIAPSVYAFAPIQYFTNKPDIVICKVATCADKAQTSTGWSAALSNVGDLYVTGYNANGQLGQGNTTNSTVWVKYPITGVKSFRVTLSGLFTLTVTGDLYFSGLDVTGFLGTANSNKTTPVLLMSNVTSFSCGGANQGSVIIIKSDGTVWTGGNNAQGQLGKGNTTNVLAITQVPGITNAKTAVGNMASAGWLGYIGADLKLYISGISAFTGASGSTFTAPTGGFQGKVSKAAFGVANSTVLTIDGELWNVGQTATRGLGTVSTNATDNATWAKVPIPSVVDFRLLIANSPNTDGLAALSSTHGLIVYGNATASRWNTNGSDGRAPMHIPMWIDNGIAPSEPPKYIGDQVGTITSASPVSVTSIVDNKAGQTVTFRFTIEDGTPGVVDVSGSTVTGPFTTQVSQVTNSIVYARTGQTVSMSFVIDAADSPTVATPDSEPQEWNLQLMVNGA